MQMKTVAHYQPTHAQSVPVQCFPTLQLLPQFYMLSIILCVMGYPLGHLGSSLLALFPSHILGTPRLLTGGVGRGVEKSLTLC